uniref:Claudin 6 n=1 Tax=Equus asinus TaxID=9793 RepID=A0A8C4LE74_EQUAS|nr:host cell factor C1 regulator 1 isoform X1 [Equus asinus]
MDYKAQKAPRTTPASPDRGARRAAQLAPSRELQVPECSARDAISPIPTCTRAALLPGTPPPQHRWPTWRESSCRVPTRAPGTEVTAAKIPDTKWRPPQPRYAGSPPPPCQTDPPSSRAPPVFHACAEPPHCARLRSRPSSWATPSGSAPVAWIPPLPTGPRTPMILQQPLERGPPGRAQRDPRAASGAPRGLDTSSPLRGAVPMSTKRRLEEEQEPLRKQFLSEENMATHFSRLSLHNDHPYCSPPMAFLAALPPLRSPCSELFLWRYPGNLIPEALRLLRLGDTPTSHYPATPAGDIMEL